MRKIKPLFLLLTLGLLVGCGTPADRAAQPPAEASGATDEAQPALSSFTAGTLDGGTFTQDALFTKDVTILNFWSTTCGPCVEEMPALAAFAGALPDNVQLLTVCLDGSGNAEDAQRILTEAGYEGLTLVSGDGDFLSLCAAIQYTPTTVFLDSAGVLSEHVIVGGQADLAEAYTAVVNQVLAAGGKDAISLEKD